MRVSLTGDSLKVYIDGFEDPVICLLTMNDGDVGEWHIAIVWDADAAPADPVLTIYEGGHLGGVNGRAGQTKNFGESYGGGGWVAYWGWSQRRESDEEDLVHVVLFFQTPPFAGGYHSQ